jgi:FHS family L-fucose permease-like MFS transporter
MISPTSNPSADHKIPLLPPGALRVFILVTGLFFLWGIPNNLNDVLIRQFMKSFAISRVQAGLVQSAFYMGYFLLALPAGILMRRKGYKRGFVTGLLLFSAGCFLFWPAAQSGRYGAFLLALFVVASGLAFLETAANPFIAQLGSTSLSEARLNLAQAFNPLGAIVGVLLGTRFIFSGIELTPSQITTMRAVGTYTQYLHMETVRVVTPYLVLGVVTLVWAVLIAVTRFPVVILTREHQSAVSSNWRDLLRRKHFLFALLAQFMYVIAQVGTWSYFIQYAQQYGHVHEREAGLLLTGTLGAFGIGRFVSSYLMRHVLPGRLMGIYAWLNVLLLLIGISCAGWLGLSAILLTSFFMSVMFPSIFAMGLKDLGPNTNLGGSLIVMTIVGGAIGTPLMGLIAEETHSTALSYGLPLLGYIVVGIFAHYMSSYTRRRISTSDVSA